MKVENGTGPRATATAERVGNDWKKLWINRENWDESKRATTTGTSVLVRDRVLRVRSVGKIG